MGTSINIAVIAKDQASKQLRGMGRQIENFAKAASSAFIGIGAAVSGATAGLLRIVTGAAQAADDLNTLSAQTGLTIEQLQELAIVAEQSGTKTDTLARGVMALINQLDSAKDPTSSIAQAFNTLGINVTDLSGNMRPMSELFPEIITALRGIEDPTERASLASSIFGRALALELLPVLALTDDEYQGIIDRAYELGRILGSDQVDDLNKANNAWKEMKGVLETTRNHIALSLLPIFERMNEMFLEKGVPALEDLRDKVQGLVSWYTNLDEGTKNLIDKAILFLASLLPIGLGMKGVIAAAGPLVTLVKLLVGAIVAIVAALGWWALAIAAVIAAGIYLYKNWDEVKQKAVEIWGSITDWINEKLEFIKKLFIALAVLGITWGRDLINGFFEGLKSTWNGIKDTVSGFFSGIGDSVKSIFKIGSPSKLFEGYGRNIGEGFELGIEKSMGDIKMDRLVPMLSAAGGDHNSYSFNPTINTGPTNLTQNDFMRLLDAYWRRATRERGL